MMGVTFFLRLNISLFFSLELLFILHYQLICFLSFCPILLSFFTFQTVISKRHLMWFIRHIWPFVFQTVRHDLHLMMSIRHLWLRNGLAIMMEEFVMNLR